MQRYHQSNILSWCITCSALVVCGFGDWMITADDKYGSQSRSCTTEIDIYNTCDSLVEKTYNECPCIIDKRIHGPTQIHITQPLTPYARQSIGGRTGKSKNRRPDLPSKSCQTKRAICRSSSVTHPPRWTVGQENWKKLGYDRTGSQRISSPRQTARSSDKDLNGPSWPRKINRYRI